MLLGYDNSRARASKGRMNEWAVSSRGLSPTKIEPKEIDYSHAGHRLRSDRRAPVLASTFDRRRPRRLRRRRAPQLASTTQTTLPQIFLRRTRLAALRCDLSAA